MGTVSTDMNMVSSRVRKTFHVNN